MYVSVLAEEDAVSVTIRQASSACRCCCLTGYEVCQQWYEAIAYSSEDYVHEVGNAEVIHLLPSDDFGGSFITGL